MGKPVIGDVVVLPFPQTNLALGKRRPALVVADATGNDLVLCQITSQSRFDSYAIPLATSDFDQGRLTINSYARVNRLFTVEQSIVLYLVGKVRDAKMVEIKAALRQLFA
jgi:mRNA interferase MazF